MQFVLSSNDIKQIIFLPVLIVLASPTLFHSARYPIRKVNNYLSTSNVEQHGSDLSDI